MEPPPGSHCSDKSIRVRKAIGPGLGGHCIPIDPFYLSWKAREYGLPARFIELAGEINRTMPEHVVKRCAEALSETGKPIKGSRFLLLGLAYKPDVDDCRESPAPSSNLTSQGPRLGKYFASAEVADHPKTYFPSSKAEDLALEDGTTSALED